MSADGSKPQFPFIEDVCPDWVRINNHLCDPASPSAEICSAKKEDSGFHVVASKNARYYRLYRILLNKTETLYIGKDEARCIELKEKLESNTYTLAFVRELAKKETHSGRKRIDQGYIIRNYYGKFILSYIDTDRHGKRTVTKINTFDSKESAIKYRNRLMKGGCGCSKQERKHCHKKSCGRAKGERK